MPVIEKTSYQPKPEITNKVSFAREKYGEKMRMPEKSREASVLAGFVARFDRDWEQEGLSHDWYNMRTSGEGKAIGFSMKSQMGLLENPSDKKAVTEWTQKTKQDLIGFKLEYLSNHLIYPCKYERSATDPTRLESREYGNVDMDETVSSQERGGSVKRSLQEVKKFFLADDTPDGSIAIMASPKGDSGLRTDDGKHIDYPDSYFFIMQKRGNTVENFTLKTDFTLQESREAIYQLTGKRLRPTDSLEAYVSTIAKIKPGQQKEINRVSDVIGKLEQVRPTHAFENNTTHEQTGWKDVYKDIQQGEKLYNFNEKTQQVIEEFERYCLEGNRSKLDLQKATAATILRMSELFFKEENEPKQEGELKVKTWYHPARTEYRSFGDVLKATAERPGCAGGGGSSRSVMGVGTVGGYRLGVSGKDSSASLYGSDKYDARAFKCPSCNKLNVRPHNELLEYCQHCNSAEVGC